MYTKRLTRQTRLARRLQWASGLLLLTLSIAGGAKTGAQTSAPQETYPAPPADRTLVYVADESQALSALPFEVGTTPLSVDKVAGSDKRSYVELKGESAATTLKTDEPRFYLFVSDAPGTHPPFIVNLTPKGKARRVTAMAQKGYKGLAIDSGEIIKPHYRVLAHEGEQVFMEIRAREMLLPGEYAIIGADLRRIATFRIAGAAQQ
ncbi:MAG: hypothetical protein QOF02_2474 [Blastocatellia bacterium]|jgi:hypothetical protein|nr:hypothetical protein [Blastocatellia bacterium]